MWLVLERSIKQLFSSQLGISPFYNFLFSQSYRTRILEHIIPVFSIDFSQPLRYTIIRPARPSVISERTLIPTFIPVISASLISDLWGRNGEVMFLLTKATQRGNVGSNVWTNFPSYQEEIGFPITFIFVITISSKIIYYYFRIICDCGKSLTIFYLHFHSTRNRITVSIENNLHRV